MTIDKNTLAYLIELSRLDIDHRHEKKLIADLEKIVASFENIKDLDVSGIQEEQFMENNTRDDHARATKISASNLLETEPNGYIQVPPILEQ